MGAGASNVVSFKPGLKKGLVLGEVAVTVLFYQADPVLSRLSGYGKGSCVQLFIACANFSTTLELKRRIHGVTAIPVERMRLMLCGAVLRDEDRLPAEAFEQTQRTTDDADVFRARMFLSLLPLLEEPKPESIISVVSEVDEEEMKAALEAKAKAEEAVRKEAEIRAIREARTRALEEQLRLDHLHTPTNFDLGSDLEKIQCSAFVQVLKKAGFADEGAFAHITDDTLQEAGLWIPRKARVRIVALADSVKRRMEVSARTTGPGALADVEKTMVTGGNMVTRGIEGLEENFTTKAQVTKAFEKKVREERRAKKEAEDRARMAVVEEQKKREPKPHDYETLLLMQHIRWRCEKDEFDLPKHCYRPEAPTFCCQKHEAASIESRGAYIARLKDSNLMDLTAQTLAADSLKRGFVPREALKMIALTHLKRHEYALSEHEVEAVLADSLVSAAQQSRLGGWGREVERKENPLGVIPAPFYDGHRFIAALADLLAELDRVRFLSIERPFTVLPYPRK